MSKNDTHTGQRVTLVLAPEQRASLDREAARRTLESGKLTTRSAVARELLDRVLGGPHDLEAA